MGLIIGMRDTKTQQYRSVYPSTIQSYESKEALIAGVHSPKEGQIAYVLTQDGQLYPYYYKNNIWHNSRIAYHIVDQLPDPNEADNGYYMIPSTDPLQSDTYEEYIIIDKNGVKAWEKLGASSKDTVKYTKQNETKDRQETAESNIGVGKLSDDDINNIINN